MEIWLFVRKLLITVAVICFGFVLQTAVFSDIAIASVVPNIMMILTVVFGLMRGSKYGLFAGFLCGLFLDLYQASYFGMFILIYLILGYFNGLFHSFFYGNDIRLALLFIGLSDIIYGVAVYVIMFPGRVSSYGFLYYIENLIVPEAVYTIIVSVFVYFPLVFLDAWLSKTEKRSTKIIG